MDTERPYDEIPRQGKHQGAAVDEEPTTNVRGQKAAYPPADAAATTSPSFRLYHNEREGAYRIRAWRTEPHDVRDEDYREVGRFEASDTADMLGRLPDKPRYVVLENTGTGEAVFDREANLTNWTHDGAYDQVTVFGDAEAAAAYADAQRR